MDDLRGDARKHAPATLRNREAIGEVLAKELPASGMVLEIASGTGEHAVFFAEMFAELDWQPSDPSEEALRSIAAWSEERDLPNLRAPLMIDASSADWPVEQADAIICINMVHISPWEATEGLFAGAGRLLASSAPLILYGPYIEDGIDTAPSNIDFDRSLKSRDPRWGLRNTLELDKVACQAGLIRTARYEMPANNLMLIYRPTDEKS